MPSIKSQRERNTALIMLKQREEGWSFTFAIRVMKIRFMLYLSLIIISVVFLLVSPNLFNHWFILIIGMVFGALLRDIGWLLRIKKSWPFTEKTTDWSKVKEIAKYEIECEKE